MLALIGILLAISVYLVAYRFIYGQQPPDAHLPSQVFPNQPEQKKEKTSWFKESADRQHRPWLPLTSRYKKLEKSVNAPFNLKRQLTKAGSPVGILEFLSFEVLGAVLFPVLALVLFGNNFPRPNLIIFSTMLGLAIPWLWLKSKIRKRQMQIKRDLPNLIDLLNICVSGGLDFMLAVNRAIRDMRPCELTRELAEVYRETQMGATRREALKNFAWRMDVPEVYSFVRTLVQADRMGTSVSEALRLQADEVRVRRLQFGEEMALKAPIKLLFPLFAFILPVVLIIVAGPIYLQFMRGGLGGINTIAKTMKGGKK